MVSSADVELENGVGLNGQEHTRAVVCSYCLSFFSLIMKENIGM